MPFLNTQTWALLPEIARSAQLQEVQKKCGCLPWSLSPLLSKQVQMCFLTNRSCLPSFLRSSSRVTASALRKDSFGCRVSCIGLNADVSFYKESPAEDTTKDRDIIQDAKVFSQLIQDYRAYKSTYWKKNKVQFNESNSRYM